MRTLIVDDSRAIRSMLRRMMTANGFDTVEAENGQEALDRLEEMRTADEPRLPNVILVDWNMPVMNGLDLIRAVRKSEYFSRIPIVMVTTETEYDQIVRAFAAGANEYVMKPFTAEQLFDKLNLCGLNIKASRSTGNSDVNNDADVDHDTSVGASW